MTSRRDWLRRALTLAAAGGKGLASAATPPTDASRKLPVLARGLNLTHWFEYERGQSVSEAEMKSLRACGFDHVRVPLDPVICGWPVRADARLPVAGELRRALEAAVAADLDVVLDLHLEPADKARIESSADGHAAVVGLWRQLARLLRDLPTTRVAFELFNEPQFYGLSAMRWPAFQQRLWAAVREEAPAHLVLLTGHQGSSPEGLARLVPLPDPLAAYVFHYYAPYLFTHQGAHWMDTRYSTAGLHQDVRYPSREQIGRTARLSRPHPRAGQEMADYLAQDWGPGRIAKDLRLAGDWARRHGVRLLCNEFGVLRAAADPASRYRWISDVRRALESERIGWTIWDYTDIFGITVESGQPLRQGSRRMEREALDALGLSSVAQAAR